MSTPSDDHDLDAVREQAAKTLLGGRGRIKAKAYGLTPVQAARRWYGDDTLDTIGATLEQDHVELTDDLLAAIRDGDDGEMYEPTDDSPVYVVGTQDGAEAVSGSDVSASARTSRWPTAWRATPKPGAWRPARSTSTSPTVGRKAKRRTG